jgi:serpin B
MDKRTLFGHLKLYNTELRNKFVFKRLIFKNLNKRAFITGMAVLLIIALGAALPACTEGLQETSSAKSVIQTPVGILDNVIDANNQFAVDLFLKFKSKDGNIFFSPYSIFSALEMAYEGARGQTAEEMQRVLHLPADKDKIHSDFLSINDGLNKGLSYGLPEITQVPSPSHVYKFESLTPTLYPVFPLKTETETPFELFIANAIWAQKDYPFKNDYISAVEEYFRGKATNLDFVSDAENSRIAINNWIKERTEGKIQNLIPEGLLGPLTKLVITNAIYFKAHWLNPFDTQSTADQDFKLDSGDIIKVQMMHQTAYFNYGETSNLQILEMPYVGNDLSMLIILPKGISLKELENSFTVDNLAQWKNIMKEEKVQVSLPKFKFETQYFMAEDLKEMGMPTAFKYPKADFAGMSKADKLYINQVIHQAFVEVTEYATEAAGSTGIRICLGLAPSPEELKIFTADHPFMFIIQQNQSGNILFMGRVSDPSK